MRVSPWSFVGTLATATTLAVSTASFGGDVCSSATNSCCVAAANPGCSDVDCCNAVCAVDSFCCTVQWDGICAGEAISLCAACGTSCTVDCSSATVEEGEPCGNDDNGGCNNPSDLVSFVDVGDIICGQYWAEGGTRDTDWYEFTVLENKVLTISVTGQITTNLFLVSQACPASVIQFVGGVPGSCDPVSIVDVCVPAGTYRIVVTPAGFNSPACDIDAKYLLSIVDTGEICTAPAGDTCDDAIPAFEGDNDVNTIGAFTNGDPLPAECVSFGSVTMFNDVWYTFTPSASALYQISTCNQVDFDSRLAIYSGDCVALDLVGCNDDGDGCAGFSSLLLAGLDAGVEYHIRVGGFGAASAGTGIMSISQFQACEGCPGGATPEVELCGEDLNGGCNGGGIYEDATIGSTICGTFWAAGGTRDTDWYKINLAESAIVNMNVNANIGVTIALIDGNCPPLVYIIEAQPGCGAALSFCLPAGDNVVFVAPSTFDGTPCDSGDLNTYVLTISSGDACTPVTCGSEDAGDCCTANGTPFCNDADCCSIVCSVDPFCCSVAWDGICADEAASLCPICAVDPPANDECTGAVAIFNGDTGYSTAGATTSGPPLDGSCDKGFGLAFVQDIWFSYTATCTDVVNFSTCGQVNYDSRLAIYSGTCANLSLVACNDDGPGCPGFSSSMDANLVSGTTYLLRVGGFGGNGSGTISINCGGGGGGPANNECADATELSLGSNPFSTILATGSTVLPAECVSFASATIFNDVWYTYTATGDGTTTVSTCDSANFDTRLAVYTGTCDDLVFHGCNDDGEGCAGFTSILEFEAVCGETYTIVAGAFTSGVSGTGTLEVSQAGTCDPQCIGDLDNSGAVNAADLALLLGQWGGSGSADLDGSGSVNAADLAILLGAWGSCS